MKKSLITMGLLMFSVSVFAQDSVEFSQDSIENVELPRAMNRPEIRKAFESWESRRLPKDSNAIVTPVNIQGKKKWLIYFSMQFEYSPTLTEQEKKSLLQAFHHSITEAMYGFNRGGSKIDVMFATDANLFIGSDGAESDLSSFHMETYENKKYSLGFESLDSIDPIRVTLLKSDDPYWMDSKMTMSSDGSPRAHALSDRSQIYLNVNDLSPLMHELNHIILRNADAYKREEEKVQLQNLNMVSMQNSIDPVEIYLFLRSLGVDVQGWKDYVASTYKGFWIGTKSSVKWTSFYSRASYPKFTGTLWVDIRDLEGKSIFKKMYGVEKGMFPDSLDISFLKPGTYRVRVAMYDWLVMQHDDSFVMVME